MNNGVSPNIQEIVNQYYEGVMPSLAHAAWDGHVEIVRELLTQGADIEACDRYGYTPLHSAAIAGHVEVVRHLLEQGADIEARDIRDYTPLHFAARDGRVEVVRHLLAHGANIEERNNFGTPIEIFPLPTSH